MIDFRAARAQLGAVVLESVPAGVTVYPAGTAGPIALPAVVIGMPRWEADTQPCMDTVTWAITVAVARPGSNDDYVITELDQLWPAVADGVRNAVVDDQTLAGTCKAATVIRAEPTFLTAQGVELPAQTITLETYG